MHPSLDLLRSCRRMQIAARAIVLFLLLLAAGPIFAANVTIATFQLLTRGILEGGAFSLETSGEVEIAFGGGYKFGGQLLLSLNETNLEQVASLGATYDPAEIEALLNRSLLFQSASVVVRDTFGLPFEATYSLGKLTAY